MKFIKKNRKSLEFIFIVFFIIIVAVLSSMLFSPGIKAF